MEQPFQYPYQIGLGRGLRAAIIIPIIFAFFLYVIQNKVAAQYAVYGSFAHLVLVTYDKFFINRIKTCLILTAVGVLLIIIGVFASQHTILAILTAFIISFFINISGAWNENLTAIENAALLLLMLTIASPVSSQALISGLVGWILAGIIAVPILLVVWIPLPPVPLLKQKPVVQEKLSFSSYFIKALRIALAMSIAISIARLFVFQHSFWMFIGIVTMLVTPYPPNRYKFLQQQIGNMIGFVLSALLVLFFGNHLFYYWLILPFIIFLSSYLITINFIANQATFTIFVVILYSLLASHQNLYIGLTRVEEIAIGGTIGILTHLIAKME